ncbi:MAG: alpha/beta fold hydrolase [Actinomycetota bacterium]|nr:alpha/beta fold hydrolase [Actinomycetota bacterium]
MTDTSAGPVPVEHTTGSGTISMFRRGQGPPLLALHAAGGAGEWNEFLELLSAHHDVIAPDHPGFGRSDDLPEVDSMARLVAHYVRLLDDLGLDQVDVVGASFGGWIAAELASTVPDRVRRLVLMAPAGLDVPGAPPADLATMTPEQIVKALYLDPLAAVAVLSVPPTPEATARAERDARAFERFARSPFLHNPELPGRLAAITAPTLVLAAEEDRIIPRAHSEAYAAAVDGAVLDVVPGCGHALYFEQPAAVAEAVLGFLAAAVQPS